MTNQNMSAERGSFNEQPEVKSQKGKPGWLKKVIRGGAAMLTILGAAEGSAMAKDPGDYPEIGQRPSVDAIVQEDGSVENEVPFQHAQIVWEYVNVRREPAVADDNDIGDLYAGDIVTVLEIATPDSTWFRVKYDGGEGWVIGDSLQPAPAGAIEPDETSEEPAVVAQGQEEEPVRPPEPPTSVPEVPTDVPEGMIGLNSESFQIPGHEDVVVIPTAYKDDNEFLQPLLGTELFTPFDSDFSLEGTGIRRSRDGKDLFITVALTSGCVETPLSDPTLSSGVCVGMLENEDKEQEMIVLPTPAYGSTGLQGDMELFTVANDENSASTPRIVIEHLKDLPRGTIVTFKLSARASGPSGTYRLGVLNRLYEAIQTGEGAQVESFTDDEELQKIIQPAGLDMLQIGALQPSGVAIGYTEYPYSR